MSDDAPQLVDEISTSKKMDEWVLEIGALLDNQVMSHPTIPSIDKSSTDEEESSIIGNWKCWNDFGVSFLPKTKKWEFVGYMKRWCGLNVRSCLEEFEEKEDLAWGYYLGVDEQFRAENSKHFIEHLLGNSCFLIFTMVTLTDNVRLLENLGMGNNDDRRSTQYSNLSQFIAREPMLTIQYMLTIDYQIPWFVVEAVYTKHSNLSQCFRTPIHKLALSCFDHIYPLVHKSKVHGGTVTVTLPPGGFRHLLHMFHWTRSPQGKFQLNRNSIYKKLLTNEPLMGMNSFYIPSATDMQLSETVFKKHPDGSIDVSYFDRRLSGVIQLAPLDLFKYSTKLYESLLRFEQGYGLYCGLPFTAYVSCMVCLLQTEEDVKLLRAKGIVPSMRNDEKDILDYVQEFKTFLSDNTILSDDLYDLSKKVMARHERKFTRCFGEFKSRYCSNRWITISVVAGILLFVLTFIQTLYGTLSYYKQ